MRVAVLSAVHTPVEAPLVAAVDAPGTGLQVVRRCADLAEVTALVIAGIGSVAVLSGGLPGADRDSLARLKDAGAGVVLLAEADDVDRCRSLGADAVLPLDAGVGEIVTAIVSCARRIGTSRPAASRPVVVPPEPERASRRGTDSRLRPGVEVERAQDRADEGREGLANRSRLVAVWGPHGAPGRTTMAVNLAAEIAALGRRALLVDADTWGGSVAQVLGLLDESAGLAAAARAGGHGVLDEETLVALSPEVEPGLRVLTGLTRPGRWRELAPSALDAVWQTARLVADWTVIDCGFSVEDEGAGGFEAMLGPRRNGATLSALSAADVVVVVGAADPVGIQRLVQGMSELDESPAGGGRRIVVANRLRASAAGAGPERSVTEALARYAGVPEVVLVPDDRSALDRATLEGRTLRACAPGSPARLAIADLASALAGGEQDSRRWRRSGRRRRRLPTPAA